MKNLRAWTQEEEECLKHAILRHCSKFHVGFPPFHPLIPLESKKAAVLPILPDSTSQNFDWHAIAAQVPGRSNKDCRKKWTCCLAPHIKKGPWDATEVELLNEGVRYYGVK
jgi:hypothetical protein